MVSKVSVVFLIAGFSAAHAMAVGEPLIMETVSEAISEEPLQDLHNAIKGRNARYLSFLLFGEDLSWIAGLDAYPTDWYHLARQDFLQLLEKRNSEGESVSSLCEEYPDVRVIRVLNYARRIAAASI